MTSNAPLLSVRDLSVTFSSKRGWAHAGRAGAQAVRGVSFDLEEGECLALVGESGSGKTTLARGLLRLVEPTEGEVLFRGSDVLALPPLSLRAFRKRAQMVFQDPFGSLNPRLRAGAMLDEVLAVHGSFRSPSARLERADELLELVGLHPNHAHRFPHQFSGGQRQRLGIARALSVEPELLILDEPVSALDLSVQAQILNLLLELKEKLSLTVILVAHDLAVVRHVADRVAVMYAGRIVESGPVPLVFQNPFHPYTRCLIQAADSVSSDGRGSEIWNPLPGEPPSPFSPLEGCPFHLRCPHPEKDPGCVDGAPQLEPLPRDRDVACRKETKGSSRG